MILNFVLGMPFNEPKNMHDSLKNYTKRFISWDVFPLYLDQLGFILDLMDCSYLICVLFNFVSGTRFILRWAFPLIGRRKYSLMLK